MGFEVRVLERTGALALVERTNTGTGSVHWEVWRMQQRPAQVFPDGRFLPAREIPPTAAEWGEHGWAFTTLTDALQKYRFLGTPLGQKGGY